MTRAVAVLAAMVLGLSIGAPEGAVHAGGPPLRYLGGPAGTLDPAFISGAGDVRLLLQLYAGLTRLDETGEPYPSLAEGWRISDDGLTYEFQLRDGLQFSDGSELVAEDVRRSWLRLLDPATGATAPDVLSVVDGAQQRLAGAIEEEAVGISAPDDDTLVVRLRHPASYFLDIVATPAAFVVPRNANATPRWQTVTDFVGSGPYIASDVDGGDLVLTTNPHYVAGPPPIDEIRWVAGLDATDPVTAFSDGLIDLTQVAAGDATWMAFDEELGTRLNAAEPLVISYFGFDTTRPPFDDARVRLAFALALDREELVRLADGTSAQAAPSLVPPAIWPDGFVPELVADPDRARELLDEAGYEDRADLGTIVVNGTQLNVEPAVAVWREELGADVVVENMDFSSFLEVLESGPAPHLYTVNWIADYTSPHALYGLLLEPGALSNYGDWRDQEFVALLEAAAAAAEDEVGPAYDAVDEYVAEQAPVIPWSYGETWWLVADGLRGVGNLTIGLLDFGRVSWEG
ncbi:MAG: ABC transporter substrate-binding protein [Candidatus Limnocylindria bacterium]